MKLEKFKAGKKNKVTISILVIIIIILIGALIYESYALYEDKKTFNVLNGTIPEFGSVTGEVRLAYTIDGAISNKPFPNKNDGYGSKKVTCESGVEAEWNDVAWGLMNVVNKNNVKQINCTIDFIKTKIYGVERELASSNSTWTRTNDAQGLVANAQIGTNSVQNDFDAIYPWSDIKSYNYNTSTKKITAWYGDINFKFDGSNGEVLTYIPEFYYKRYQDGGKEYIAIAKKSLDGYTKSEAFSVGRYTMSGSSAGVHSKSGVLPLINTTISDYRTYARNLGVGFGIMDYHYFILQLLYLVEYADYNTKASLGPGYSDKSYESPRASGSCDILGMHSGSGDGTNNTSIIYRGIEDIYGNVYQYIDGINIKDHQAYICYNQSLYEVNKYDNCYQKLGYISPNNSGSLIKLGYDANNPLIALPLEVIKIKNVDKYNPYYTDYGDKVVIVGGRFNQIVSNMFFWEYTVSAEELWYDTSSRLIKIY